MIAFARFRSTRLRFVPNLLISAVILLVSCSPAPAIVTPPPRPPALQLPPALSVAGPAIPFHGPNPLGDPQLTVEPFTEIGQLEACLALGQTVYGIALQNTNVRESPTLNSCRVGRIPRGTLVAVTGIVTTTTASADLFVAPTSPESLAANPDESTKFTSTITTTLRPTLVATPLSPQPTARDSSATVTTLAEEPSAGSPITLLGYQEDIQPIFQRNCIACHSAVVQQKNLQVTAYAPLMRGSSSGDVVIPGDSEASILWQQVDSGKMPLIGELKPEERELIRQWIDDGALERRQQSTNDLQAQTAPAVASSSPDLNPADAPATGPQESSDPTEAPSALWLTVADESIDPVPDICEDPVAEPQQVVSADLILPISCGVPPRAAQLQTLLQSLAIVPAAARPAPNVAASTANNALSAPDVESTDTVASAPPAAAPVGSVPQAGLQAAALGLGVPSDNDLWLTPRGGFCMDQHFTQNERAITALAFAPDGRLFVALDSRLDGPQDNNILYDAYHPSRSIVVYDPATRFTPNEIMNESSRITGMAYANGAVFLNRAGEVGWIQDGATYRTLAGGFAVNSQLFHANDGIAITNGYVYISAGGVRDGYSDGPLVGIGEAGAQNVVSGGNRFAARLLRASLDRLINEYNIELFETAARGLRNPYGLTVDPSGRLWFTDNGATNVPENVSAGDEVNLYVASASPPGTPEESTPYYGFPLALTTPQSWYTAPVVALPNTSAPTGITWAYGTIFFGQYGRDPGLYRLGRAADGQIIAERVMLAWPLLAVTTAPDGALWIGTGSGGLYRMTPGC